MQKTLGTNTQLEFCKPAGVAQDAENRVSQNKHHLPASTALLLQYAKEQRTIVCKAMHSVASLVNLCRK